MARTHRPDQQALYDPSFEHENCGVGFVAHIKGKQSHQIIEDAKEVLLNMTHRGAVGAEKNTGDGAGILTTLPQKFIEKVAREELKVTLAERSRFSAGLVFLPQAPQQREECKARLEMITAQEGQEFVGWRRVPKNNERIGPTALAAEPVI